MKNGSSSLVNLSIALLLILALVVPAGVVMLVPRPAQAAVTLVTVTGPITGSPVYAFNGGTVTVSCNITTNATTAGDLQIYIYQAGTQTIVGTIFVSGVLLPSSADPNPLSYPVLINSGTYTGNCDVLVSARQPASSGSFTSSALQTNAVIIDSNFPGTPSLLTPSTGSYTSAIPTFTWSVVTPAAGHTINYWWQRSASPSFTSPTDVKGLTTTTYTPGSLTDGLYYWRVKAYDVSSLAEGAWSAYASVFRDSVAPTSPSAWTTTGGGFTNPVLSWSGASDAAPSSGLRYGVQIDDTSTSFTHIISAEQTSATTYTRSVLLAPGTYYWRVQAYDLASNAGAWTRDSGCTFTITATYGSYSIPLTAGGWNLISLPVIPPNTAIATVLAPVLPYISKVFYLSYASGSAQWLYYPNGGLTTLEDGKAYWISVTQNCQLAGSGSTCPGGGSSTDAPTMLRYNLTYNSTIPESWNMLGFKSTIPMTAHNYLANLAPGAAGQKFVYPLYHYAGGWIPVTDGDNLTPGKGYFIQMNASGSVVPPCQ